MNAGRELDALVAEKVIGWKWATFCRVALLLSPFDFEREVPGKPWMGWTEGAENSVQRDIEERLEGFQSIPHYSTDIAAAWEVVEKMRRDGYGVHVGGRPDAWEISIINAGGLEFSLDDQPTAPLSICLAALQAVGS